MLTLSDGTVIDGGYINLPAIFIVSMLSLLLIRGTQESASINNFFRFKVAVVLVFIILVGILLILQTTHHISLKTLAFWSLMVRDCCWCRNGVLAFIGFDAVSTAAQEAKIHKRNYWYFRISSYLYYIVCFICSRNDRSCTVL
jgi:APA family basic amino acid/polyamine antiporter